MANKLIQKINSNPLLRSLVLAFCIVVLFVFLVNVLLNLFTRHNSYYSVPNFTGMTLQQASSEAKKNNFRLEIIDSLYVPIYEGGVVLEQTPTSGTEVKSGRRIFLTVNSFKQRMVEVPYVAGYSLRQAKNNLEIAGLTIDKLIYKPDIATNNVLEQRYQNKTIHASSHLEVEIGSSITLVVGMDEQAPLQNVPKVIGLSLKDAQSRLWELGLNINKVELDQGLNLFNQNEGRVYFQSLDQATEANLGDGITIKLTLDFDKVSSMSAKADLEQKERDKEKARLERELDSLKAISGSEGMILEQLIRNN